MSLSMWRIQVLRLLLEQCNEEDHNYQHRLRILALLIECSNQTQQPLSRWPNIDRSRELGYEQLMKDYFVRDCVYGASNFRRRFRMRQGLFERIFLRVTAANQYFVQKLDAVGVQGLYPLQKMVAAIRMLAYDRSADDLDEYLRIGESTSLLCLSEFCKTVVAVYGPEYLCAPTVDDVQRILTHSAQRGFPGMLGSLDCMHWKWKNCPRAWAGQFSGRSTSNSLILEAVAMYDLWTGLWIWHAFFGMPGSNNDINVMDRSSLFTSLLQGQAPQTTFTVNNRVYHMAYFLTDGIYPHWPVFVQTISNPLTEKRKYFAKMQESARKDIERCFGVLRARWAILKNPTRIWNRSFIHRIMSTCIILHNMILENEQNTIVALEVNDEVEVQAGGERAAEVPQYLANRYNIRNQHAHHMLQSDLVEHLWRFRGQH